MKNGWYPNKRLGNKNIPKGVAVTGSLVTRSCAGTSERVDTYFKMGDHFFRVGSSLYETPKEVRGHRAYV